MPLTRFHPAVGGWFREALGEPTECQARAWPAIDSGRHTLVAAPTGSGKTLAAFLTAIDALVRQAEAAPLPDETRVLYVSPLKALGNDIQRNLERPLAGIAEALRAQGRPEAGIRTLVRTGDTPAPEREAMRRRPPHILVTTPESLYLLLTGEGGRRMLGTVETVIVDEIHAVAGSRRGSHLALSLERLRALTGRDPLRIGLSATQSPIEAIARFLVGTGVAPAGDGGAQGTPECTIVDTGYIRRRDLALEVPASPLEAVTSSEVWTEVYDRLAELIRAHRTTLVFVNTRRLAERVARHLGERLGPEAVSSHHGSLARERRLESEQRLKAGDLRALVATASLELGIDIGDVDLVCQLGSTRAIATLLQRAGRAGHAVHGVPKARLFPLSRDELVECVALLDAVHRGELDRVRIPSAPLDVLAQQIVATVACEEWGEDALYALVRRAHPYRDLARADFDAVVRMLAEGYATRRGRRGAYLHRDAVHRKLRARRGARLTALTSGGAIPDTADYDVLLEPTGTFLGTVNEDFAIESLPGHIFQLGNASWRILRVEPGKVRVEDARGQPPNIPFWLGEAPARTDELSASVVRLRGAMNRRLSGPGAPGALRQAAVDWLAAKSGVTAAAAAQVVDYLASVRAALGVIPDGETLVLERFFDESGGMQLVVHSPAGGRINRAWGLALRKRFCRRFNFELQAAAGEDAIVLSLGETHSFPVDEVAGYLAARSVRDVLTQALLDAPVFTVRWRWNAAVSLAVPRFRGGRKVPAQLQRMQAEDLLSAVFPDQLACLENVRGRREIPDHPLVRQTLRDCLEEATDAGGLERLLGGLERGERRLVARDRVEPSPLAHEILNARPYAFLDDAPLEERPTQAVLGRRWLDPDTVARYGALDAGAVARVRDEAWPQAEGPDELHDALLILGFLTESEAVAADSASAEWLAALSAEGRATILRAPGTPALWAAAERLPQLQAVHPDARLDPSVAAPPELARHPWTREAALLALVRSRLEALGPVTPAGLARPLGVPAREVEAALAALESEGFALRGRFTPDASDAEETEWCERRLLARIHRYTVARLRREIEPVASADYLRFLLAWQHVAPGARLQGAASLAAVVEQLEGFEAPAAAWEADILPARTAGYEPGWLDDLCLSGRIVWARPGLSGHRGGERSARPVRATPIALLKRERAPDWFALARGEGEGEPPLSSAARKVEAHLKHHGASFFADVVAGTGLLRTQVEGALAELVARGRVTADSFKGLRALLLPSARRRPVAGSSRRRRGADLGPEDAGRWTLLPERTQPSLSQPATRPEPDGAAPRPSEARTDAVPLEGIARTLLRRYGIVFKRMLAQEPSLPPWRELLRVYRRLEARGEIRGGRFVAGFAGEQFALPEAVPALRDARRQAARDELVSVSGADPLNLVGIVTPGARVPALATNRILYRDGVPVAVYVGGQVQRLERLEPSLEWDARNALLRRHIPAALRPYLA